MWVEPCLSATGGILVSSAKNWHCKFDPKPSTEVTLCVPSLESTHSTNFRGDARSLCRLWRSIFPFSWDTRRTSPEHPPFEEPRTKVGAGCASLHQVMRQAPQIFTRISIGGIHISTCFWEDLRVPEIG